ncbi:MAG: DNA polymerase III subunit delta [Sphingomicrobium sp.]
MKPAKGAIGRAVDQPDQRHRLFLMFGPDNAQARALGDRLVEALGASRLLISGASVKSDPASLADEAGAMSLFGGKRVVWVEPAGEDVLAGVTALFEAPPPESPVVAIAGELKSSSGLRKLAEGSPLAVAIGCYPPSDEDAVRMVVEIGRRHGLEIASEVAARVAASCDNDRALVAQELIKLALYLDASTNAPRRLEHDALDAVGAENAEGNMLRLADWALNGDLARLTGELAHLSAAGSEAIPVVRALQRRLLQLAPARAQVERGRSPNDVMAALGKSLFWKDKELLGQLLTKWDAKRLSALSERVGALERDLMFSPVPERDALGEELIAIARAARRS